jgi:hypothetical protein
MKILVIVGPDGSGKSSIVDGLRKEIGKLTLVYCGRKNFNYKYLESLDYLISNMPTFLFLIKIFLRYCIYYPIEFIDVKKRLFKASRGDDTNELIICERYFVDRAIRYFELLELRKRHRIRAVTFFSEYLFAWVTKFFYLKYLKKMDTSYVFLNVNHHELFRRNNSDYRNSDEALAKSIAYNKIFHELQYSHKVQIDTAQPLENCVREILHFIKYEVS